MPKAILMDIEGTTTSISFVHDVLFPYAKSHLSVFVQNNINDDKVKSCLEHTKETVNKEESRDINDDETITTLLHWIDTDRKHPALKTLQGFIWKNGYESCDYTAHVYDDVLPCMKKWSESGIIMAIYSSGSITAQKLLFKYTNDGDLTPFISNYFDLSIGRKQSPDSYANIVQSLNMDAKEILFLSDTVEELDAAKSINIKTTQLVRPGTNPCKNHPTVKDFTEIDL